MMQLVFLEDTKVKVINDFYYFDLIQNCNNVHSGEDNTEVELTPEILTNDATVKLYYRTDECDYGSIEQCFLLLPTVEVDVE